MKEIYKEIDSIRYEQEALRVLWALWEERNRAREISASPQEWTPRHKMLQETWSIIVQEAMVPLNGIFDGSYNGPCPSLSNNRIKEIIAECEQKYQVEF